MGTAHLVGIGGLVGGLIGESRWVRWWTSSDGYEGRWGRASYRVVPIDVHSVEHVCVSCPLLRLKDGTLLKVRHLVLVLADDVVILRRQVSPPLVIIF